MIVKLDQHFFLAFFHIFFTFQQPDIKKNLCSALGSLNIHKNKCSEPQTSNQSAISSSASIQAAFVHVTWKGKTASVYLFGIFAFSNSLLQPICAKIAACTPSRRHKENRMGSTYIHSCLTYTLKLN